MLTDEFTDSGDCKFFNLELIMYLLCRDYFNYNAVNFGRHCFFVGHIDFCKRLELLWSCIKSLARLPTPPAPASIQSFKQWNTFHCFVHIQDANCNKLNCTCQQNAKNVEGFANLQAFTVSSTSNIWQAFARSIQSCTIFLFCPYGDIYHKFPLYPIMATFS